MKRIKLMLLSLALFAVVGASLAFKARFSKNYCTSAYQNQACTLQACVNHRANSTTVGADDVLVCTTTAPNADCTTQVGTNIIDITCTTTSTSLIRE